MNENFQNIFATLTGLPGWAEAALILIVAVLLFGKRLPTIARNMGKSLTEFKKGLRETQDDVREATDTDENKKDIDQESKKPE